MENAERNRHEPAMQGRQALAALTSRRDASRDATWFQGHVSAEGSTAYLVCGKLGEHGAVSLRLVIRHVGSSWLNVTGCSVDVDGRGAGEFAPAKAGWERTPDGRIIEMLDADFENVRPIVSSMLGGRAATIHLRGEHGNASIALGVTELDEMRKVFAAYEYLVAQQP